MTGSPDTVALLIWCVYVKYGVVWLLHPFAPSINVVSYQIYWKQFWFADVERSDSVAWMQWMSLMMVTCRWSTAAGQHTQHTHFDRWMPKSKANHYHRSANTWNFGIFRILDRETQQQRHLIFVNILEKIKPRGITLAFQNSWQAQYNNIKREYNIIHGGVSQCGTQRLMTLFLMHSYAASHIVHKPPTAYYDWQFGYDYGNITQYRARAHWAHTHT